MRLISEYEPVQSLVLSFVQDFFNTRFHFSQAQASRFVGLELHSTHRDLVHLWGTLHIKVDPTHFAKEVKQPCSFIPPANS